MTSSVVEERAGIGHGRSRRDDAQVVADDVGDDQRVTRPLGASREPAAFDRRQVLADGVERVNVGPRAKELDLWSPFLSSSVTPSAGTAINADAPPDSKTTSVSPGPSDAAISEPGVRRVRLGRRRRVARPSETAGCPPCDAVAGST